MAFGMDRMAFGDAVWVRAKNIVILVQMVYMCVWSNCSVYIHPMSHSLRIEGVRCTEMTPHKTTRTPDSQPKFVSTVPDSIRTR